MSDQETERVVVGYIRYEKAAPNSADIYARIKEFAKAKEAFVSSPGQIGILDGHTNWEAIMYVVPFYMGEQTGKDFAAGLHARVPELTQMDEEVMPCSPSMLARIKADSAKL